MFEQCKIVIFNNIIFMKKHRKFSGKMQWKFSEIFRKNMKFSGKIFRLTSLHADNIGTSSRSRPNGYSRVVHFSGNHKQQICQPPNLLRLWPGVITNDSNQKE